MADNRIPRLYQQNEEDVSKDEEKPMQYQMAAGAYVRCGQTKKKLEPGFYDVVNTGPGTGMGLKPKAAISDELIDLKGTVADDIFVDIDSFMQGREDYQRYGLTHKRGYLFYGPPGTGKTSLGLMLAKRFIDTLGGIVMYAGDVGAFYHGVSIMRDVEPGRPSMYLIEEADAVVNNTHCLSILDGELSIQGAVFVAMTNYKKDLPPRISNRPGRFDRVTHVTAPPTVVQVEYLRRIGLRGLDPASALSNSLRIVEAFDGLPVSMAHLREAFISHTLMKKPLPEIRERFEVMAGLKKEPDPQKTSAGELKADDEDADETAEDSSVEEEEDLAREQKVDAARYWSPTDDE